MADVESALAAKISQQRRAGIQRNGTAGEEDEIGDSMNEETDEHR